MNSLSVCLGRLKVAIFVFVFSAIGWLPAGVAQPSIAVPRERAASGSQPMKYAVSHQTGPFRGWGVYTEELDGQNEDAAAIADLGVSYVIYFYRGGTDPARVSLALQDFQNLAKFNIDVALWVTDDVSVDLRKSYAAAFKSVPNLISWYVFDEPVHKKKSVEDQNQAIAAMRSIRDLPCSVAEYSQDFPTISLSSNYDFVFSDRYHQYVNDNRAVRSDKEKLIAYGAIDPLVAMFGIQRVIPVYGAYGEKTHPVLADDELLATFTSKRELYGPGAFFVFDARKSAAGALTTLKNSESLRKVVKALVQKDMPDARMLAASTPIPGSPQVNDFTSFKSAWQKLTDRRTTARVDFKPGRLPMHSGAYLTKGQFIVLDFGRSLRAVRLFGRFFNKGSVPGAVSELSYARSVEDMMAGKFLSQRTIVLPPRRELPYVEVVQNVNSRFLVILASEGEWNLLSGFDALGFEGIPE